MAKVLVVEDDKQLAKQLQEYLIFEHFTVECVADGSDALQLLETSKYDAILLDWNLPGHTGVEVCRRYRALGGTSPILMLTGKGAIDDKVTGFDSGADDYLTKPFDVKELVSRLRALLRRPRNLLEDILEFGSLKLEPAAGKVAKNGDPIHLQPTELALLEYFMRHPNEVFSSKALLASVWKADSKAGDETVRTYMKTLRRKITAEGEQCPIRTVHGLGYVMDDKPQEPEA